MWLSSVTLVLPPGRGPGCPLEPCCHHPRECPGWHPAYFQPHHGKIHHQTAAKPPQKQGRGRAQSGSSIPLGWAPRNRARSRSACWHCDSCKGHHVLGTPGRPHGHQHLVRVRPRSRHPSPRLDIQAPSPLRWDARPACHVHIHSSAPPGVQQVPGGVTIPSPRARGSGLGTRAAGPGAGKRRMLGDEVSASERSGEELCTSGFLTLAFNVPPQPDGKNK